MTSNTRCPKCETSRIATTPAISGRPEFPMYFICYGAVIVGGASELDGPFSTCLTCGCHWNSHGDVGALVGTTWSFGNRHRGSPSRRSRLERRRRTSACI